MLLNIYLGTTAISWITTLIFSEASDRKLKRKGYKFYKKDESFVEKLANSIGAVLKMFIPVYNILNAIIIMYMGDRFYDYMEKELLKKGAIYKSKEYDFSNDSKRENSNQKNDNTINVQNIAKEKTYNEMTVEEKLIWLQQEREKLISESTSQTQKQFTLH